MQGLISLHTADRVEWKQTKLVSVEREGREGLPDKGKSVREFAGRSKASSLSYLLRWKFLDVAHSGSPSLSAHFCISTKRTCLTLATQVFLSPLRTMKQAELEKT